MTREELLAAVSARFPQVLKASSEVKGYLTLQVPSPGELVPLVSWLKGSLGFDYLDMLTGVDYKGPVDARGFIMDPNPNAFLPEGATPQADASLKTAGFPYREAVELVYCLSSLQGRIKVFLKLELPRDNPSAPSLTPLYKAADWQEREAYDLLGVRFDGHPNLVKILTPDFIQGHPLRKDYVHVKDRFD